MSEAVSMFHQFIKFGTDAYGLERLLRALQALTTLLLFSPPIRLLFTPLFLSPTLTPALTLLRKRLSTLRQPFRLFRFLDSFSAAWSIFSSSGDGGGSSGGAEQWMDFGSKAFTGVYMLLESLVFVDVALDVPGLAVWGSQERGAQLVVDGQRFWFLGLVCAVVRAGLRLRRGWGRKGKGGGEEEKRMKKAGEERWKVVRRMVADVLDLAIPGSVVGWVRLSPEMVGWCMLVSTILTGLEVWERCGREVAAAKEAAARAGRK
ncbi:peroxisomal biogenesis factor 11 [Staphylotrichum tortipilum]|uniref:Peroxisomal biogenesis factor 11 n=1 Tax=Staphylotrichum tortipilum TaxID=2831512 RepID=A0AAN6MHB5_9PEZI|nr:peroxisomal biogenesis factor 11 [Staphylotrichum longicolle]